jgi:hypothetical protein
MKIDLERIIKICLLIGITYLLLSCAFNKDNNTQENFASLPVNTLVNLQFLVGDAVLLPIKIDSLKQEYKDLIWNELTNDLISAFKVDNIISKAMRESKYYPLFSGISGINLEKRETTNSPVILIKLQDVSEVVNNNEKLQLFLSDDKTLTLPNIKDNKKPSNNPLQFNASTNMLYIGNQSSDIADNLDVDTHKSQFTKNMFVQQFEFKKSTAPKVIFYTFSTTGDENNKLKTIISL